VGKAILVVLQQLQVMVETRVLQVQLLAEQAVVL
jgi:hypothetical protein